VIHAMYRPCYQHGDGSCTCFVPDGGYYKGTPVYYKRPVCALRASGKDAPNEIEPKHLPSNPMEVSIASHISSAREHAQLVLDGLPHPHVTVQELGAALLDAEMLVRHLQRAIGLLTIEGGVDVPDAGPAHV